MKQIIFLFLFFVACHIIAQKDTHLIKVHFYYGSKPKFKYRKQEKKYFGGLHGGHVSMQVGDTIFSFVFTGKAHIFNHKKNKTGVWINESLRQWVKDTVGGKYASITVPINDTQYHKLKLIQSNYCSKVPYDYAFLGMRCASSTYDVFAQMGFFKHRSRMSMVTEIFYPKILRKKFFKLAKKHHWKIEKHEGNPKRKWERR